MIFTPHLLIGAAVAIKTQPLSLAFLLAFLSHYFLDSLPHSEYSIKNFQAGRWKQSLFDFLKIFLDMSLGVFLILILTKNNFVVLAAASFAILADGLTFLSFIFPKNKFLKIHHEFFHLKIHFPKNKKSRPFWEIFTQSVIIAAAVFFLLFI